MNIFDIKDKVIIITGGYGTLGSSIAKHLINSGAKVAILGRDENKAKLFANQLSEKNAIGIKADVLDKENLISVKSKILEKWQKIDVLINAAGGNMPGATLAPNDSLFDISIDDFQNVTDLNLMGTVIPSLVFGEYMAQQGNGSIINVSSVAVANVLTRVVGYSASKAAMENFTRWMSVDMALKFGDKIRVNAIAPGFFLADQNRQLLTNEDGSLTERGETIVKNTPMKRFGDSEELNGAVHLLVSNASKFMTGTVIHVDGGFSVFSGV
ncbi:NAD(P)-dependent dehydrogenase (short-subunit alcohol dehydrogenase family) [Winogradskyella eximia]|uniref:NAD(P)-dependent dehydrogenase, short-chain alcohol dehydrogenase family n=2 Tax=Winogradskyella TaxID=286104 RepID=A0A1G7Y7M7_9FLAO|nr:MULTISPECIES: SDR family oxidoreductase [Winogradskyella]RED46755.1 NAD(P)-dependent dehydrogenase (short-subunit alcohol dehydrogenase family) [Winogradskyella eximia]SDG92357.1 NAD(P)-dependent dehydrogenase, short-chain alcohol dehydrogenase family [Winogradskyella thalassocola]|tara:strand:+ start:260 stop:1066 length:807 start_codon:yes stop_codon:yes gene_type:complete